MAGRYISTIREPKCRADRALQLFRPTHDALMPVYHQPFAQQVETVEMETVLSAWT